MSDMNRAAVIRRVTGAVLASSLTDGQIFSLARSLVADRGFVDELSRALLTSINGFSGHAGGDDLFARQNEVAVIGPTKIDQLVKWIVGHNISKKSLIQKMLAKKIVQASPGTLQSESIREIVIRVATSASPNAMSRFMDILGMTVESDAYLDGIEGRRAR